MAQVISEIMTHDVQCVPRTANLCEAAKIMRDRQIGDVLVTDKDGTLFGILTDRDMVVRAIAEGGNPERMTAGEVCSREGIVHLDPDAQVEEAVKLMRDQAVRRLPVVRDGKPVGIVSLGDLARVKDPRSALAEISEAAPTN
jgi:CBS domain-containing protein